MNCNLNAKALSCTCSLRVTLYAELDDTEEISIPHEKILDCLTTCIHVADINDILEQQEKLMHLFVTSLSPGFPWTGIHSVYFYPLFPSLLGRGLIPLVIKLLLQSKYRHFHQSKNSAQGCTMYWLIPRKIKHMLNWLL